MPKSKKHSGVRKISIVEDIWDPLIVCEEDILEAFNYATVSLPWTFDRMRYGPRSQKAVNNRLIHVFIGVLNQTMLERILTDKGYDCLKEWKNYRDSDIFDFQIGNKNYDVKTMIVYKRYNEDLERRPFSKQLLINFKDYSGPEWRNFFPIMVTISQLAIDKMKEGYIFGIAECFEDLRKRESKPNDGGFWCVAPYKEAFYFFQSTIVIKQREQASKGFKVRVNWRSIQQSLNQSKKKSKVILHGEWNNNRVTETLDIQVDESIKSQNEFSSLCCVQFEDPWILSEDKLVITVENEFNEFIPKSTNPSINLNDENFEWVLDKSSFINLKVPDDYQIYWIGFIPFNDFAINFPKYPSYFIPHPQNMNDNQKGRINNRLREKFTAIDNRRTKAIDSGKEILWPEFSSFIDGANINAGILVVATRPGGRVIGAACYYYPPYAMQETALYVLPRDLHIMDSL